MSSWLIHSASIVAYGAALRVVEIQLDPAKSGSGGYMHSAGREGNLTIGEEGPPGRPALNIGKDGGDRSHDSSFVVQEIPLLRQGLRARSNAGYIRILISRSGGSAGPALFGLEPSGLFLFLPLLSSLLLLTLLKSRS